jgi:hypothetical protein
MVEDVPPPFASGWTFPVCRFSHTHRLTLASPIAKRSATSG